MAEKFYAVKIGKTPGIYRSWEDCKAQVSGYPGAVYKSFPTVAECEDFFGIGHAGEQAELFGGTETASGATAEMIAGEPFGKVTEMDAKVPAEKTVKEQQEDLPLPYAFVDGSFGAETGVYGYGGFLVWEGGEEILQGSGSDEEMAAMRNVAGEVSGCMAAVRKALELGLPELTVYYDYSGIEMWATGQWKRNKQGTQAYYEYIDSVKNRIALKFVKVKGHSGIEGNEKADTLAKEAVAKGSMG